MRDGLKSLEIGQSAAELDARQRARNRAAESYWKNRPLNLLKMKAQYQRERAKILAHYGSECACCGETQPLFLTIDHVNNDGHEQRKKRKADYTRMGSWLVRNGFPEGFQLLCMNCNQGKHRNGGICPHQEGSTTMAQASSSKWSEAPEIQSTYWVMM